MTTSWLALEVGRPGLHTRPGSSAAYGLEECASFREEEASSAEFALQCREPDSAVSVTRFYRRVDVIHTLNSVEGEYRGSFWGLL